jgi:hypothetical protein
MEYRVRRAGVAFREGSHRLDSRKARFVFFISSSSICFHTSVVIFPGCPGLLRISRKGAVPEYRVAHLPKDTSGILFNSQ